MSLHLGKQQTKQYIYFDINIIYFIRLKQLSYNKKEKKTNKDAEKNKYIIYIFFICIIRRDYSPLRST